MADFTQSFLGKGWQFPPAFSRVNNSAQMATGVDDIQQSIHLILGTIPGERMMQPLFGCNTHSFVFEKVDTKFIADMNDMIRHALLLYEPRIKFLGADISHWNELEGIVYLVIRFAIIATNTRHNMVYPFYLSEGTNIINTM